jgi:3-oxoacyl-[acyl-carrier protein] reductase
MQLQGKTVVITGGGRGIGRQMAASFAAKGANIAVCDLNAADLEQTVADCKAKGVTARSYLMNVAKEPDVVAAMAAIAKDFGSLDVLINNAGITRDGLLVKVKDGAIVGKMSLENWNLVVDVNMTGVFLCGREAAEKMIQSGKGGVIINISSISRYGNAGQTNYSATKAGVAAMAEVWGKELARYNIRTRRALRALRFSRPCDPRCSTRCSLTCPLAAWVRRRKLRAPLFTSPKTISSPRIALMSMAGCGYEARSIVRRRIGGPAGYDWNRQRSGNGGYSWHRSHGQRFRRAVRAPRLSSGLRLARARTRRRARAGRKNRR